MMCRAYHGERSGNWEGFKRTSSKKESSANGFKLGFLEAFDKVASENVGPPEHCTGYLAEKH